MSLAVEAEEIQCRLCQGLALTQAEATNRGITMTYHPERSGYIQC